MKTVLAVLRRALRPETGVSGAGVSEARVSEEVKNDPVIAEPEPPAPEKVEPAVAKAEPVADENGDIPVDKFTPRYWTPADVLLDKINFACGHNTMAGWVNVDGFDPCSYPHGRVPRHVADQVFFMNLADRLPFPDNCFQYAYSEDFVEHLDQEVVITFLSEVLRTLKPGGVFRVSTPGLEGVMERHFFKANFDEIAVQRHRAYSQWGHRQFLCKDSLGVIARGLGFSKAEVRPYGQSPIEELNGLETRPDQSKLNLVMELTK